MSPLRRFFSRLGLVSDRRHASRMPIFAGARLELDVVTLTGTARDLSAGGVFFETAVPLAPGVRGALSREGSRNSVPVTVSWWRAATPDAPGGLGLTFE